MIVHPTLPFNQRCRQAANSIIEVMIGIAIAVMTLSSLLVVLLQTAGEQRTSLADASLQQEASYVCDRLRAVLRPMSITESVLFASPVGGTSNLYQRIIVARGETSINPQEEIRFDRTNYTLIHWPDRKQMGTFNILSSPNDTCVLRELYFYPSYNLDTSVDSTTINVSMTIDDNGYARRLDSAGSIKRSTVYRAVTIKLRNR